jgi:hypothetical protein
MLIKNSISTVSKAGDEAFVCASMIGEGRTRNRPRLVPPAMPKSAPLLLGCTAR